MPADLSGQARRADLGGQGVGAPRPQPVSRAPICAIRSCNTNASAGDRDHRGRGGGEQQRSRNRNDMTA